MDYWVIQTYWQGRESACLDSLFVSSFQAETFVGRMLRQRGPGYSYTVRPATWREREHRMMSAGVYQPPVWSDEGWWQDIIFHLKDHYTHVSLADPTAIAFTEDERKGEADRQTSMRPGKYLQKFLGGGSEGLIEHGPLKGQLPRITKMQIAYYASWHQTGARPESEDILDFTEDPDMMVRLYEDGPASCMMGKHWDHRYHPVRVYAGGGLALAYLTSVSGDVIGRALCWPAKQVFGRVYPTPNSTREHEHHDELMARLKAKGWKSINEDNNVFNGALLTQVQGRYGDYVMPYLDHEYGVREVYRDGKNWWVMDRDETHQENTDGTMIGNDPDWHCESCEEGFSDSEDNCSVYGYWAGSGDTRRPHAGYPRAEQTWCCDCRDNSTFYCDGSEEHYVDNGDSVYANDGCTYERHWFDANGGWQCTHSDEYYLRREDPPVVLADGSLMHPDNVEEGAFLCRYTGLLWHKDCESDAVPGYHGGFDGMVPHPAEYECVVPAMPEDPEDVEAWALAHVIPPLASNHAPPIQIFGITTADECSSTFVTPRDWARLDELLTTFPLQPRA